MYNCLFCSKSFDLKCAKSNHQRYCQDNPDKVAHHWLGRKHEIKTKRKQAKSYRCKITPTSILDFSTRTTRKILKRLNKGCSNCGWDLGGCDIHHILPKKKGGSNDHFNLTILCPNCHRLAYEGKLTKFITVQEYIGDDWKKEYYSEIG